MAIAELIDPIAELRGHLKKSDSVYVRMLHGKCILQHKPRHSSAKQQKMRKAFGEKYKGKRAYFDCGSDALNGGEQPLNVDGCYKDST